jgi:hypothetical protein
VARGKRIMEYWCKTLARENKLWNIFGINLAIGKQVMEY